MTVSGERTSPTRAWFSPPPADGGGSAAAQNQDTRSFTLLPVVLAGVACLIPIWAARHLPMVDLPQHAAQLALWIHRDDPLFFPAGAYRFNWFAPYLGAYLIAHAFALVASVPVALKLTVSLGVVALPLSAWALVRETGGDPWWAVAAAPLAFGVSFYAGFLNFLIALPLAVLLIASTSRFAREPSAGRGILVGVLGLALAVCHALAYGIGLIVALGVLWAGTGGVRPALRRSGPLFAPLPLLAAWAVLTWLGESQMRTPIRWSGLPSRLARLPSVLVGRPDAVAGIAALAVLAAALVLLGVRPRAPRAIVAPLAGLIVLFLLAPDAAFHTVVLPERFAALLAILVLPCLRLPKPGWRRRASIAALLLCAFGWSAHLARAFRGFDEEMRGFDDLVARMEPGRVVRVVPLDAQSAAVPGFPFFWHVGGWYQVEKGGFVGFSFSQLFPVLVRYRATPPWAESLQGKRGELNWRPEDRAFDYFVIRTGAGDPAGLFPSGEERPQLLARSGAWWLFGRSGTGSVPVR